MVQVHDMFVSASSQLHMDSLTMELYNLIDIISCERGLLLNYLGMVFEFRGEGKVKVSRWNNYIDELQEECKVVNRAAKTPAGEDLFTINDSATISGDKDREYFKLLVAKLLYTSKRTHPDILTPVSFLRACVKSSTTQDILIYRYT